MAMFGHTGVSSAKGVSIIRRGDGRLFVPEDVFKATLASRDKFDALMYCLDQLPAPIPEGEKHTVALHPSWTRASRADRFTHLVVSACKVSEMDEVYWDEWVDAVGYVEPYEQMLTCAYLVNLK